MEYHMIVEQTKDYKMRMRYDPAANTFTETGFVALGAGKRVPYPYGWIEESGTPPQPHWDVILISEDDYKLGDRLRIKIVGVFFRNDGDHKFIAVKPDRETDEFENLEDKEKEALHRLYSKNYKGDAWLGRESAMQLIKEKR